MHLGLELAHFTLLLFFFYFYFFFFSPYHLCMLHVTLILDLVTHCCVCLVFVDGMGGEG